ncbi:MAG: hypothetical protein FWE08_04115 [Oscillospiraceae bacterium]|nr:hypothetical protein [Oscillospiraceae bacterium]
MDFLMTAMMGLILYAIMIPLYFFSANYRLPKKNIILGVTVPYAHHQDAEVEAISKIYLRRLRLVTLGCLVLGAPAFFVPMSVQILIMLTVLLLYIAGGFLVFVRANRALMTIKRQSGWQGTHTVPAVADFRAMEEKSRPLPRLLFILPCLVAAVPLVPLVQQVIQGRVVWDEVLAYALTVIWIPLILVLSEAIRRQNAEIVGAVSDLNVILTRIRRREYLRCMALTVWLLALTGLAIWFQTRVSEFFFLALMLILTVVVVVYAFKAEFAVRRAQEKYTKLVGDTLAVDDDEYWLWGYFYHNKNDKRLIIKERVGIDMGLNLAKPLGLICMLLAGLALIAMPLIGVWMVAEEFTPIEYSVEGNVVTAAHLTAREFDLGEHFEIDVIDVFPSGTRTMGTAIGTLRKGNFNFEGIGPAYALLHTDRPPFVVITAEDGQVLVFNFVAVFEPLLR